MKRPILQIVLAALCVPWFVSAHTLTLEIVDAPSGQGTGARLAVLDAMGESVAPTPRRDYVYQDLGPRSYFYAHGAVSLSVPDGTLTVYAAKGFEYLPATLAVEVNSDTTVTILLQRWIDPRNDGWFSGETHTHLRHSPVVYPLDPPDMALMMESEDLHFVNVMDEEMWFTGGPDPLSSGDRVLYFSKEYRNPHFGHLTLVGLQSWVPTVICSTLEAVACAAQLDAAVAENVHAQNGAIVIGTHVWPPKPGLAFDDLSTWPGQGILRSLPLDLVGQHLDALDILCYTHKLPPDGLLYYYRVLNAGFRLSCSAGTDAILSSSQSRPPGGYRVYVDIGNGPGAFNSDRWIARLRAGRTFVTNYPIFTAFEVNGRSAGSVVRTNASSVSGSFEVRCALPMQQAELVADGEVVQAFPATGDNTLISGTFSLATDTLAWVAVRATGTVDSWHVIDAGGLFAETGPVYVQKWSPPPGFAHPKKIEAAAWFIDWTQQLIDFYADGNFLGNTRAEFDSATTAAIDYFQNIVPDPPGSFALLTPMTWSPAHNSIVSPSARPIFRWQEAIDPDPGGTVTYTLCYGTDSTFAIADTIAGLAQGSYEVPMESPLEPLRPYFWKVVATDNTGASTPSTPVRSTFIVDVNATGVPSGQVPEAWALERVRPNPFNPSVRVSCDVPTNGVFHTVDVHDVSGGLVRRLYAGVRPPGVYDLEWDGRDEHGRPVASGVYFLRLAPYGRPALVRKAVLVR